MIHNRSVKEVRRFDIFKLVVLLVLLLLLIFQVSRDEAGLSGVATGDESSEPSGDEPASGGEPTSGDESTSIDFR